MWDSTPAASCLPDPCRPRTPLSSCIRRAWARRPFVAGNACGDLAPRRRARPAAAIAWGPRHCLPPPLRSSPQSGAPPKPADRRVPRRSRPRTPRISDFLCGPSDELWYHISWRNRQGPQGVVASSGRARLARPDDMCGSGRARDGVGTVSRWFRLRSVGCPFGPLGPGLGRAVAAVLPGVCAHATDQAAWTRARNRAGPGQAHRQE